MARRFSPTSSQTDVTFSKKKIPSKLHAFPERFDAGFEESTGLRASLETRLKFQAGFLGPSAPEERCVLKIFVL